MVDNSSKDDAAKMSGRMSLYWREIERYDRAVSDWHQEGDKIVDLYMDAARPANATSRRFALLWSNVETLKPAVYAKVPTVLCTRRYKDKDPIARTAAELMERATNTSFDLYGVDETFKMVRDDRLLAGRGQAWVRYEATLEQYDTTESNIDEETGEPVDGTITGERLKSEKVCVDYVHWRDFGHNCGRTWNDVWLVWRIVYKTQPEVAEHFGSKIAASLSYDAKTPAFGSGSDKDDPDGKAKIYELWDKRRNLTSWMVKGHPEFLETGEPPINFRDGFPCPAPCYATKTSKELIPKPDYQYYRDQQQEINDLTARIHNMSKWLMVKGFLAAGSSSSANPLEEALRDTSNNALVVSVDNPTEWLSSGGAGKMIEWLDTKQVVESIAECVKLRDQIIADVYQITGISDILRGASDPNETLGAQELKAQTGSRRLKNTKDEIARFCKDVAALVAEVIAEKFEPETIAEITGFRYAPAQVTQGTMQVFAPGQPMPRGAQPDQDAMQQTGDGEMVFDDRVMALLRNDKLRGFRIDVETDSTIAADENADKQRATELLTAVTPFMKQAIEGLQVAPALGPVFTDMLMYVTRRYRAGASMEDTIEQGFKQLVKDVQAARQAAAQQPNPEMIKVQMQAQADQARLQLEARSQAQEAQLDVAKAQTHARIQSQKLFADLALKKRQQDLDSVARFHDRESAANAQAKDRAAKLLTGLKPQGNA